MSNLWLCETATAGPDTPPHVRRLSNVGPKPGGGADTLALCGREVAWDVMAYSLSDPETFPVCLRCAEAALTSATEDPR